MRRHEEHDIQSAFILEARKIRGCEWIHAIPNATKGGVVAQIWLNREGRLAGVPDVFLPRAIQVCKDMCWYGLFFETKIPDMIVNGKKKKRGELKEEQAEFIMYANSAGYGVSVYRSVQEGIEILLRYLRGEHSNDAALAEARKKLKKTEKRKK
jgi:hypothetical protein